MPLPCKTSNSLTLPPPDAISRQKTPYCLQSEPSRPPAQHTATVPRTAKTVKWSKIIQILWKRVGSQWFRWRLLMCLGLRPNPCIWGAQTSQSSQINHILTNLLGRNYKAILLASKIRRRNWRCRRVDRYRKSWMNWARFTNKVSKSLTHQKRASSYNISSCLVNWCHLKNRSEIKVRTKRMIRQTLVKL